ncbi:MAG: sugar ABC transporter permease [Firmicutes bacterium]|nr:sugar ABC transporter permease [Bacillota bacterium]
MKNKYFSNPKSPVVGFLFLLPVLIYISIYFVYPFFYNISLSYHDTDVASFVSGKSSFNGLDNYIELFTNSTFQRTLKNTAIFTVFSLVFQFSIGFILALIFNRDFPGEKVLRGLVMIPWFLPLIVSASAYRFFFSEQGIVNGLLLSLKLISAPINWLTDPSLVIWTVTFINIWIGIPFNFVLLHTGLKDVPKELYEAAEVDGAKGWQKLLYIIIPILKPVILTVLMMGTVYTIKHFDIVWIATQGGPANSSHLLSTLSYKLAFRDYEFGLGAATANVMVVIILFLVLGFGLLSNERRVNR